MTIKITDKIGISEELTLLLVQRLINNRRPKEGSYDYGLETHGLFDNIFDMDGINRIKSPIQVWQSNKRKSSKSPIEITIEKHTPIL